MASKFVLLVAFLPLALGHRHDREVSRCDESCEQRKFENVRNIVGGMRRLNYGMRTEISNLERNLMRFEEDRRWTLAFKVEAGSHICSYCAWSNPTGYNPQSYEEAIDLKNACGCSYVNHALLRNWTEQFKEDRTQVSVSYWRREAGMLEKAASVVFDARNTNPYNWFKRERVIESTYDDIRSRKEDDDDDDDDNDDNDDNDNDNDDDNDDSGDGANGDNDDGDNNDWRRDGNRRNRWAKRSRWMRRRDWVKRNRDKYYWSNNDEDNFDMAGSEEHGRRFAMHMNTSENCESCSGWMMVIDRKDDCDWGKDDRHDRYPALLYSPIYDDYDNFYTNSYDDDDDWNNNNNRRNTWWRRNNDDNDDDDNDSDDNDDDDDDNYDNNNNNNRWGKRWRRKMWRKNRRYRRNGDDDNDRDDNDRNDRDDDDDYNNNNNDDRDNRYNFRWNLAKCWSKARSADMMTIFVR